MTSYDLIIKDGKFVIPKIGLVEADLGIENGKIIRIDKNISYNATDKVINANKKVIFPGIVDAHSHFGIYRPLTIDARTESCAAVTGGITTVLNIVRPRPYYLNMTGPLINLFNRLLELSKENYLVDYGYALAPVERSHLEEIEYLIDQGVSTYKFFMHYRDYNFSEEPYDTGFLLDLMEKINEMNQKKNKISRLSIHCEDPEIIRVKGKTGYGIVLNKGYKPPLLLDKNPLKNYYLARPPIAEAAAIAKAMLMAYETKCPINILHITSEFALSTIRSLLGNFKVDATFEATIHHLTLTIESNAGILAKVNPPIREKRDVEALWNAIETGLINVVASDHACTPIDMKRGDAYSAMFGFGGNTLLCPIMINEGFHKRGIPLTKIAELISYNPSKIHGFYPRKGTISVGSDADLTIVDVNKEQKVTTEILNSAKEYTPFEGMLLKGWPITTIIRGKVVFDNGTIVKAFGYGEYIKRPVENDIFI